MGVSSIFILVCINHYISIHVYITYIVFDLGALKMSSLQDDK